jgi:hypothetical protein
VGLNSKFCLSTIVGTFYKEVTGTMPVEGRRGKPYAIRHGEYNGDSIRNAIQEKVHKFTSASSSNETLQVSRIYDPNRSRLVVYILGILFCIFHEPARQARSLYLPQQRFDARLGSAQGSPT